jgi:hypothetical protein
MKRHITLVGAALLVLMVFIGGYFVFTDSKKIEKKHYLYTKALKSKHRCDGSFDKALLKSGLEVKIPTLCTPHKFIKLNDESTYQIIDVAYDIRKRGMMSYVMGYVSVPVLKTLDNELFIFPHHFSRPSNFLSYVSKKIHAPFAGGWSNFKLETFSDLRILKKGTQYCLQYSFKFPFTGQIDRCPNTSAITDMKQDPEIMHGNASFVDGVFKWDTALSLALNECHRYNGAKCKYSQSQWAQESKYHYWSGAHANSAIKIGTDNVDFYLFSVGIYNKGKEDVVLVQVYSDGRIRSKLVPRKSYKPDELLSLAESFEND